MSLPAQHLREHLDPLDVAPLDATTTSDLLSSSALASFCVLTQRKRLPPLIRDELRALSLNDLPELPENSLDACLQQVSNFSEQQPRAVAELVATDFSISSGNIAESEELGPSYALGVLRCVCDTLFSTSPADFSRHVRPALQNPARLLHWPQMSSFAPPTSRSLADVLFALNRSANESLQWPPAEASTFSPPNAAASASVSSLPPAAFVIVLSLLVLLPLVTVLGNVLVVVSVLTDRALRHSLTNNYILSLAFADVAGALRAALLENSNQKKYQ